MTVFRRRLHDSYYQSYAKMVSLSIRNVFTLQYICEQKSVRIILSCLTLTLQRNVGQVDVNSGFSTVTFKNDVHTTEPTGFENPGANRNLLLWKLQKVLHGPSYLHVK